MPGDAIVNPEELVRFARELTAFCQQLRDSHGRLQGAFSLVSETWRDQQQQKFLVEFDQMTKLLRQFDRNANEHIPLLLTKAGKAADYLGSR